MAKRYRFYVKSVASHLPGLRPTVTKTDLIANALQNQRSIKKRLLCVFVWKRKIVKRKFFEIDSIRIILCNPNLDSGPKRQIQIYRWLCLNIMWLRVLTGPEEFRQTTNPWPSTVEWSCSGRSRRGARKKNNQQGNQNRTGRFPVPTTVIHVQLYIRQRFLIQ